MIIEILCGCGWGSLAFKIEDGDFPVCPCCGFEFPMYEIEQESEDDE